MDEAPRTVEHSELDPLLKKIEDYLKSLPSVLDAQVRLREGHVYFGEAFVVVSDSDLAYKLETAQQTRQKMNWRIHDLNMCRFPVWSQTGDDSWVKERTIHIQVSRLDY
jgi:hypothetical protein